ncbi:MAG: hypothetical protein ACRDF6_01800, partial [bacterium]
GLGDAVQTMKAGIMEIGEVFVINKADQGDSDRTITEVKMMLGLNPKPDDWKPPVLKTVATSGQGVADLLEAIDAHRRWQQQDGRIERRRRARRRDEIIRLVELRTREQAVDAARRSGRLEILAEKVSAGELDPYSAADEILKSMREGPCKSIISASRCETSSGRSSHTSRCLAAAWFTAKSSWKSA